MILRAVLPSVGDAACALESIGGHAAQLGIKPGDKVSLVKVLFLLELAPARSPPRPPTQVERLNGRPSLDGVGGKRGRRPGSADQSALRRNRSARLKRFGQ